MDPISAIKMLPHASTLALSSLLTTLYMRLTSTPSSLRQAVYAKATTARGYTAQADIRKATLDVYYMAGLSVSGYAPFKPSVFCINKAQKSILA